MTGVGAVLRVARVSAGSSVVVFGCGAVGLNVIQGAALVRSEPLIAVDIEPDKLKKASLFGATHTVQADTEDAIERVRALTGNRGADYSFEAAGSERTLQYALEATRAGGGVVILGKVGLNDPVTFRFGSLVGEKRIIRSSYGGARPSRDFPLLAQWYLEGKLRLDELIDLRIPLANISSGYAAMRNCGAIRTIIEFPH
jgi:S-(hydroxymethyl)glutathione dehydrogenase/alcohol dehydrogenase